MNNIRFDFSNFDAIRQRIIANDLNSKSSHQIMASKNISSESIKQNIEPLLAAEQNINKRLEILNAVKLAIKTVQEAVNHGGCDYAVDHRYYGDYNKDIFEQLIGVSSDSDNTKANTLKESLESICLHRNVYSYDKNRKFSFWGTNYTKSAESLRAWIDREVKINKTKTNVINNYNYRQVINKNSDNQNIDLDNGFEVINNIDDNNFEKSFDRYYNGQLSSIEIESLISSIITKRRDSKKKITIKPYTIGGSDINQLLDDLESQSDGSILTLIPYGITKRCLLLENHSVLVAIYQNRIYVIDPKSNWFYANPQINKKQYQQINLGIQRFYDRKNCGRYTVFIATKLVELFFSTNEDVFDLSEQVKSIKNPNIKSLQEHYGNIIKKNF